MKQKDERFLVEKPQPVYDEMGNIRYYEDDEYFYVKKHD